MPATKSPEPPTSEKRPKQKEKLQKLTEKRPEGYGRRGRKSSRAGGEICSCENWRKEEDKIRPHQQKISVLVKRSYDLRVLQTERT
jgi:hypothetical protein